MNIQKNFFEKLRQQYSEGKVEIVQKVMSILNVKKSSAYKRMSGETALTTTELIMLSEGMGFSLDDMLSSNKYYSFLHPFIDTSGETRKGFIEQFQFYMAPLSSKDGKSLVYLTNELPLWHYFNNSQVFHFILSIWNHLHWQDNKLIIDNSLKYDSEIKEFQKLISDSFSGLDVTEIWNSNMLNNLYQQIHFSITIRAFQNLRSVNELLDDVRSFITYLKELTEKSQPNRKIYVNEFGNYLNLATYSSKSFQSTFIGFDYPKFLVSQNPDFYNYSLKWIDKIKKRSVLISGEGLQYRETFFRKIEKDYDLFYDHAKKLISIYYE